MPKSIEHPYWVPKFLVKNFADADGNVFCQNILTDEITKLPPKRTASSVGFNEFLIHVETVSFENQLKKIETQAAPILKRIVSSRSTAGLTAKQKNRVANFMAAQNFRTQAFYKAIELQSSRQQFGPIFAQLWRSACLVSNEIERRKWVVMTIDGDEVFYLGDHPVVLQRTEHPPAGSELGLDIQGVEAYLPLTPKCALYMPCTSISDQIISGYEDTVRMHQQVRIAALRGATVPGSYSDLLHSSQRVMRDTLALRQALTTGVAITAVSEHVENLNYLQCAWAHMAVYSSRKDFTFADRMFRESLQYRLAPKTALGILTDVPGSYRKKGANA